MAGDGGREHAGVGGLGDIVMVPSVRDARDRGVLRARPMFDRLTRTGIAWANGAVESVDAIHWCTGFRPALRHLAPLRLRGRDGRIVIGGTSGTQALEEPRLFLIGYGDWTGPASATLHGKRGTTETRVPLDKCAARTGAAGEPARSWR